MSAADRDRAAARSRLARAQARAEALVAWLTRRGVALLCVDFDQTLSRIAAGPVSSMDAEDEWTRLVRAVSDDGAELLRAADAAGLGVAITSFSNDAWAVPGDKATTGDQHRDRTVLGERMISGIASRHAVLRELPLSVLAWTPRGGLPMDKNLHLRMAMQARGLAVAATQRVALIDDDPHNVLRARQAGFVALGVPAARGIVLDDLLAQTTAATRTGAADPDSSSRSGSTPGWQARSGGGYACPTDSAAALEPSSSRLRVGLRTAPVTHTRLGGAAPTPTGCGVFRARCDSQLRALVQIATEHRSTRADDRRIARGESMSDAELAAVGLRRRRTHARGAARTRLVCAALRVAREPIDGDGPHRPRSST